MAMTTEAPGAKSGIRDPKFINIGRLYLARRAVADGEPKFVMELDTEDLVMLLVALSAYLPEDKKLADLQEDLDTEDLVMLLVALRAVLPEDKKLADLQEDFDDKHIDRMHVLGDSIRELFIRATRQGHNHMWHCLLGGVDDDATVAELALTAYGREVAEERPEMDALEAMEKDAPDGAEVDEELPGVIIGKDGVTAPHCGVIIDT